VVVLTKETPLSEERRTGPEKELLAIEVLKFVPETLEEEEEE
jgi:hypothetical protein